MTGHPDLEEPRSDELWTIEAEAEVLGAEVALVDSEAAWFSRPSPATAAGYLQALIDVADLHDLTDHHPAGRALTEETRSAVR